MGRGETGLFYTGTAVGGKEMEMIFHYLDVAGFSQESPQNKRTNNPRTQASTEDTPPSKALASVSKMDQQR